MPHIVVFETPPPLSVKAQVLDMAQHYVTDLSLVAIPPSNHLYEYYQWLLGAEVDQYLRVMGQRKDFPVELVVAFDDHDGHVEKIVGFLLYLPIRTVPDACGVTYMAVDTSHRRSGIGKAMIAEMTKRFAHVELTCPVSKVPFYEKQGFQVLDVHRTQVVMNTRSYSAPDEMGIIDAQEIAKTPEANQVLNQLLRRWGRKAMEDAERRLLRHLDQLTHKSETFVRNRHTVRLGGSLT